MVNGAAGKRSVGQVGSMRLTRTRHAARGTRHAEGMKAGPANVQVDMRPARFGEVEVLSSKMDPPADEPGVGETHDADEAYGAAGPSMDIDMIEDRNDDHTDLDSLMAVLTNDARKEIVEANGEIVGFI